MLDLPAAPAMHAISYCAAMMCTLRLVAHNEIKVRTLAELTLSQTLRITFIEILFMQAECTRVQHAIM